MTLQPGILALGTASSCHLELDRLPRVEDAELVRSVASLEASAGVELVVGFRPETWAAIEDGPRATSFTSPVIGPDGFTMPATQHDVWLWVAGPAPDVVFDAAVALVASLVDVAVVAHEISGWLYRGDRDLTGFVDGTENPLPVEVPDIVTIPSGEPGAGSTVVLLQTWRHLSSAWRQLDDAAQERVIGRTKPDSVELDEDVMPADSHVARTVVEQDGEELEIFRRNTAYGTVGDHGTHFVGFSDRQAVLHLMLERMAGIGDGVRDALTRYADPLTGSYYVVPSVEALEHARRP